MKSSSRSEIGLVVYSTAILPFVVVQEAQGLLQPPRRQRQQRRLGIWRGTSPGFSPTTVHYHSPCDEEEDDFRGHRHDHSDENDDSHRNEKRPQPSDRTLHVSPFVGTMEKDSTPSGQRYTTRKDSAVEETRHVTITARGLDGDS